jgi:hypothetical protein
MKLAICALLGLCSSVFAGTSMVASSGKGKGNVVPPTEEACPNYLTYRQFELSYLHIDGDDAGTSQGADLRLNYQIAEGFFAYTDFAKISGDFDNTSFDLGLGTFVPLCKNFHLVARAGYSYFDADVADSNGWHAAVGFRTQIGCHLELNGKAQYGDLVDFEDGDSWSYGLGAAWHFNSTYALVAEYVIGEDDVWSVRAGIAYKF